MAHKSFDDMIHGVSLARASLSVREYGAVVLALEKAPQKDALDVSKDLLIRRIGIEHVMELDLTRRVGVVLLHADLIVAHLENL